MKEVMIEFPLVGYAEVTIEVEDDMSPEDILDAIRNDEIEILYDGHSHVGALTPLLDIRDARNFEDYPHEIGVIE